MRSEGTLHSDDGFIVFKNASTVKARYLPEQGISPTENYR